MENNGENSIFQNMEQIKALSKLMGGGETASEGGTDFLKTMETVKNLSNMMGLFQKKPDPEPPVVEIQGEVEQEVVEVIEPFSPSREMKVINAAIPFLDKEYQKGIFIATRLMEMKRAMSTDVVMMQKQSMPKIDSKERRNRMLAAIRPLLNPEERKNIDLLVTAFEMKKILSNRKEE